MAKIKQHLATTEKKVKYVTDLQAKIKQKRRNKRQTCDPTSEVGIKRQKIQIYKTKTTTTTKRTKIQKKRISNWLYVFCSLVPVQFSDV